jgi:hypothetical protein
MHKLSSPWEVPFIVTEVINPQHIDSSGATDKAKSLERGACMLILPIE